MALIEAINSKHKTRLPEHMCPHCHLRLSTLEEQERQCWSCGKTLPDKQERMD